MLNILKKHTSINNLFLLFVLVIAIVAFSIAGDFPGKSGKFPRFILSILIGITLLEIVLQLFKRNKQSEDDPTQEGPNEDNPPANKKNQMSLAIGMIIYIVLIYFAGFIISTFLFIFVMSLILGMRSWIHSFLLAIGMIIGLYFVFVKFLSVPFPSGIFWS